ncbi:ferritin-like domain-containing protein [Sporolactobacillus vineae]|uniref:ferritin-like domain-containing protein n=1 Tax=Sporolactobacillus vineae TaxID=444463 RepID=UPI000289998A|nr:ferritin-like domain-containing protein [Sporolactobacillus vineae]
MTIDEQYQTELAQSERDHHTPTAGAMVGHILANLKIHRNKLSQGAYFVSGDRGPLVRRFFQGLALEEDRQFDRLAELMLDEHEVIPTTSAEFTRYSMIEESGKFKYESAPAMLEAAGKDFDTQLLFLTRGIKLAEQEGAFPLQHFLIGLQGWMNHQNRLIHAYTGTKFETAADEED